MQIHPGVHNEYIFLYSSREPSQLSQWLCYDDSTINTAVVIIIVSIIIINQSL